MSNGNGKKEAIRPSQKAGLLMASVSVVLLGLGGDFHLLEEGDAGMDVAVHDFVDVDEVDALSVVCDHLLDKGTALETFLMAEVEGLGGIEKLDGEDALGVLGHAVALGGGVASHAHEVLLVLAGGDAVDTAGGA